MNKNNILVLVYYYYLKQNCTSPLKSIGVGKLQNRGSFVDLCPPLYIETPFALSISFETLPMMPP